MTMTAALWISRLAKLNGLVNVSGRSDGEDDQQGDQAEDRRQRSDVAAADAGDVLAGRVAETGLRRRRGVLQLVGRRLAHD